MFFGIKKDCLISGNPKNHADGYKKSNLFLSISEYFLLFIIKSFSL